MRLVGGTCRVLSYSRKNELLSELCVGSSSIESKEALADCERMAY